MKAHSWLAGAYANMLRLYPKEYRQEYGDQMLQTFEDMLADQPESATRLGLWLRVALDTLLSAMRQNVLVTMRAAAATPRYVQRNTQLGGALVVPFFIVILTNALSAHSLEPTNAWRYVLMTAVVVLPIASLLIMAVTFVSWLRQRQVSEGVGYRRSMFDIRHNWPMIVVGGLALMVVALVLGHDSAPCFQHNPVRLVRNAHQTWQCAAHGFLGGR